MIYEHPKPESLGVRNGSSIDLVCPQRFHPQVSSTWSEFGRAHSDTYTRKRDLIVTFRAITTLIYILQREPTLVYLGDPLKDHRPAGGTQLVEPDRDGSRAQLAELRILTALAIFLVRRRDVTAVVANDPRVHGSDTLQVIATRPEDLDLALTSGHNVRHHSFFALRNPQPSNPKVAKLIYLLSF